MIGNAALQDKQRLEAVFKEVKPGKRDIEIAAVASTSFQWRRRAGAAAHLLACPRRADLLESPPSPESDLAPRATCSRCWWRPMGRAASITEISRTCVLGKATQAMKDEFAFLLEARKFTLDRLIPGASCLDIWDSYNAFLKRNGRPEENRLYCHGQGYDLSSGLWCARTSRCGFTPT